MARSGIKHSSILLVDKLGGSRWSLCACVITQRRVVDRQPRGAIFSVYLPIYEKSFALLFCILIPSSQHESMVFVSTVRARIGTFGTSYVVCIAEVVYEGGAGSAHSLAIRDLPKSGPAVKKVAKELGVNASRWKEKEAAIFNADCGYGDGSAKDIVETYASLAREDLYGGAQGGAPESAARVDVEGTSAGGGGGSAGAAAATTSPNSSSLIEATEGAEKRQGSPPLAEAAEGETISPSAAEAEAEAAPAPAKTAAAKATATANSTKVATATGHSVTTIVTSANAKALAPTEPVEKEANRVEEVARNRTEEQDQIENKNTKTTTKKTKKKKKKFELKIQTLRLPNGAIAIAVNTGTAKRGLEFLKAMTSEFRKLSSCHDEDEED